MKANISQGRKPQHGSSFPGRGLGPWPRVLLCWQLHGWAGGSQGSRAPRGAGLLLEKVRKEHLLNRASCRTTRKGGTGRGYGDVGTTAASTQGRPAQGSPHPSGGTASLSCQRCSSSDQAWPHIHPALAPAMLMEKRMEKEDPFLQESWLLGAPAANPLLLPSAR